MYWPGSNIVKSTNNAFTMTFESVMASPSEIRKAINAANGHKARKTQQENGTGFAGNHLKALSKKARAKIRAEGV